jgi:hypothetical protein
VEFLTAMLMNTRVFRRRVDRLVVRFQRNFLPKSSGSKNSCTLKIGAASFFETDRHDGISKVLNHFKNSDFWRVLLCAFATPSSCLAAVLLLV